MARIDQNLLAAIIKKTGLSQAQVYVRIQKMAADELLPRNLAAIRVGAEVGININRYAKPDELAQLRNTGSPVTPPQTTMLEASPAGRQERRRSTRKRNERSAPNAVFVVHGRDSEARKAMFTFLRSIGISPIEWTTALKMTKKAAPYVGEILNAAFSKARAIVVLMTPDDLAYMRPDLLQASDKPYERTPTGQARLNVIFEAGMAFATHPDRTVIVEMGTIREFSDIAGRHAVHMSNDVSKRQELATKLTNAGCTVDTSGTDWYTSGDFVDPQSRTPTKTTGRLSKNRR